MIWRGRNDYPGGEGADPEAGPGGESGPVGSRIESVLDAAERAAAGIRQDAEEWARNYLDESRRKADEIANQRVRELSDLTDNLMNRARAVAQQSDQLIAALDDAGRRLVNTARPGGNAGQPDPYAGAADPHAGAADPYAGQGAVSAPAPQYAAPDVNSPPPLQASPPPAAAPAPAAPPTGPPPPPPDPRAAPQYLPPPAAPPPPPPVPSVPQAAPPAPVHGNSNVSEGARLLATQMAVAGSTRDEIAWRLREEFGIHDSTAILDEIGL